jgi:hypothetical protein
MNDMRLRQVEGYFPLPECNGSEDARFESAIDAARLPREQQIVEMQRFLGQETLSPSLKRMLDALCRPNGNRSESSLYHGLNTSRDCTCRTSGSMFRGTAA